MLEAVYVLKLELRVFRKELVASFKAKSLTTLNIKHSRANTICRCSCVNSCIKTATLANQL
jgi:hypothetical protein